MCNLFNAAVGLALFWNTSMLREGYLRHKEMVKTHLIHSFFVLLGTCCALSPGLRIRTGSGGLAAECGLQGALTRRG